MQKTIFIVQKMDCPSEEQLIRLKLANVENISALEFDIPNRKLAVYHTGEYKPIFNEISLLDLDASIAESQTAELPATSYDVVKERNLLWQVLWINFVFFLLEIATGIMSRSMGLVADSLDMLADSLVYGLALFAVGGSLLQKKNIVRLSGFFQLVLAVFGIVEVLRRFFGTEEPPMFQTMILISALALIGNIASLMLLQRSRNTEAHMQASKIFTSNDVIANVGVMFAGGLVYATASKIPDLIVGAFVFLVVARGAYRILQLAK